MARLIRDESPPSIVRSGMMRKLEDLLDRYGGDCLAPFTPTAWELELEQLEAGDEVVVQAWELCCHVPGMTAVDGGWFLLGRDDSLRRLSSTDLRRHGWDLRLSMVER